MRMCLEIRTGRISLTQPVTRNPGHTEQSQKKIFLVSYGWIFVLGFGFNYFIYLYYYDTYEKYV